MTGSNSGLRTSKGDFLGRVLHTVYAGPKKAPLSLPWRQLLEEEALPLLELYSRANPEDQVLED